MIGCPDCPAAGHCAEAGNCLGVALLNEIASAKAGPGDKQDARRMLTPPEVNCLREGGTVEGHDAKWWGVGMRFTTGKSPVWQGFVNYFPNAIREVAKVSEFGAKKYDWNNWQQLENGYTNCTNSLTRHLCNEAEKGPEGLDDESELLEAAHTAWNAMARLEFILKERKAREQND